LKKHSQVLKSIKSGVYEVAFGNQLIRVIVLSRIPLMSKNAVLQLFSGKATGFEFGQENYQWRYPPAIATLNSLFQLYLSEGVQMKPDYEAFLQQCVQETLKFYPLKERLKGVHPKEVVWLNCFRWKNFFRFFRQKIASEGFRQKIASEGYHLKYSNNN